MLTGPEHVCLPGKTGSDRRAVKVARLTHIDEIQRCSGGECLLHHRFRRSAGETGRAGSHQEMPPAKLPTRGRSDSQYRAVLPISNPRPANR
jgi:hypothetical protein